MTASAWSRAEVIPGQAIDVGGEDQVASLSCGSPGNCAGAGFYTNADDHRQALLVTEINGSWQDAARVRGLWALEDHNLSSALLQVSCAAAGYCTAVGSYGDTARRAQALVVTERDGRWGRAEELHTTSQGGVLYSVSCWAPGNCTAAGALLASTGRWQAFVVSSKDGGRWGPAEVVPGSAALNRGGLASVNYVSCRAAGQCSAAGVYDDASGHEGAFVDSEQDSVWGTAEEMPGTAKYNSTGFISVYALSCASPGNCAAGGLYTGTANSVRAFIASEDNGTWDKAEEVPGTYGRGDPEIDAIACPAAGACTAVGSVEGAAGGADVFVTRQT